MVNLRNRLGMALVADRLDEMIETAVGDVRRQNNDNLTMLYERLAELEQEDRGWNRLMGATDTEFSDTHRNQIARDARLFWLKNPLIKRAVAIQTQYVFGQGVRIEARHPAVNEVVQAFLDNPENQAELTGHQAMSTKEAELQVFANLFFVLFRNPSNGAILVRSIPMTEITDIISDPEDAKSIQYYKREWTEKPLDLSTGRRREVTRIAYYPDWRYRPAEKPATINGKSVEWDSPVCHLAVNKLSDMKFGVSELYAAFDWAKAYNTFLSNWASIVAAYARFAWLAKTPGGAAGVAAIKAKLGTTLGSGTSETNPPPTTGSTAITSDRMSLEPMRTAGATTSAGDGRWLKLMVCAATGIYEHFFGDPSTGNLATAKTMNRPMELMFRERQQLWADFFRSLLQFVVDCAVRATKGPLGGTVETDDYGEERVILALDVENEDPGLALLPIDRHIEVSFPSILEPDVTGRINAIVQATTLGGQGMPAGTFPDIRFVTRLLLQALEVEEIDEVMADLFPEGEEPENEPDREEQAEAQFTEALRELRAAVEMMVGADGMEEPES